MKEENIRVNYETIDIVEQRELIEITRDLGRLLTEEEFECIWQKETKVNFDSNRKSEDKKNKRVEKLFICNVGYINQENPPL